MPLSAALLVFQTSSLSLYQELFSLKATSDRCHRASQCDHLLHVLNDASLMTAVTLAKIYEDRWSGANATSEQASATATFNHRVFVYLFHFD